MGQEHQFCLMERLTEFASGRKAATTTATTATEKAPPPSSPPATFSPPPSYNEATETYTARPEKERSPTPSYDAAFTAATGPSSSSTQNTRRIAFAYDTHSARHGTLTDADSGRVLYSSEHRYRKPTFALNGPTGGQPIATASSHMLTNKFDAEIAGQRFELTPRNKLGQTCTYPSPAYGQVMTWQRGSCWSSGMKYTLLDGQMQPVARFTGGRGSKGMPWGSFGDLEFADGRVRTEAERDEVVATGLALAYRAAMNHNAGVYAAVA